MDMQHAFLSDVTPALNGDPRIRAAWLEGSFGRGNADRYSDIDLHLLLDAATLEEFRQGAKTWFNAIRPLVLYKLMFDGHMVNALTVDGLRLDAWLHTDAGKELDAAKARVLLDRAGALRLGAPTPAPNAAETSARLGALIAEFWRCVALAPAVLGRDELITAFFGQGILSTLLADVLIAGYEIPRDSGVKRLNDYLPPHLRAEIEAALNLHGLTRAELARANTALAALMQREGRIVAARHGLAYPAALEAAVLAYVGREMALLDL